MTIIHLTRFNLLKDLLTESSFCRPKPHSPGSGSQASMVQVSLHFLTVLMLGPLKNEMVHLNGFYPDKQTWTHTHTQKLFTKKFYKGRLVWEDSVSSRIVAGSYLSQSTITQMCAPNWVLHLLNLNPPSGPDNCSFAIYNQGFLLLQIQELNQPISTSINLFDSKTVASCRG